MFALFAAIPEHLQTSILLNYKLSPSSSHLSIENSDFDDCTKSAEVCTIIACTINHDKEDLCQLLKGLKDNPDNLNIDA
jgi:hypothetical protein